MKRFRACHLLNENHIFLIIFIILLPLTGEQGQGISFP